MTNTEKKFEACVVGGAGHVGAPLAIVLAKKGFRTLAYDLNPKSVTTLSSGKLPFLEEGGEPMLKEVLASGMLEFTADVKRLQGIPNLILTIGTPIDEYHDPVL